MKKRIVLALVVAGAMGFTSCTKKVDEKTMTEINQFSTDWTALGERATAWSTELNQTTERAKEFAARQTEVATTAASSKDATVQTQAAELSRQANENAARLESMQNEWNTFKATWDETTTQFTQWKDQVVKGEISAEQTATGLADFRTKMNDAQTRFESWNTAYAEIKASNEQQMATTQQPAATEAPKQ